MFYALLLIALLAADQLTKYWASTSLSTPVDVIHGILAFNYTENRGAAFGMMQNMQPVFIFLSIAFAIGAALYLAFSRGKLPRIAKIAGWMTVAGAIGNMIDRVVRGYVVDFVYIYAINFPIFNLADVCLTVGAALLIIWVLFFAPHSPEEGRAKAKR